MVWVYAAFQKPCFVNSSSAASAAAQPSAEPVKVWPWKNVLRSANVPRNCRKFWRTLPLRIAEEPAGQAFRETHDIGPQFCLELLECEKCSEPARMLTATSSKITGTGAFAAFSTRSG